MMFDLDGTLVKTEWLKSLSYAEAVRLLSPVPVKVEEVPAAFSEIGSRIGASGATRAVGQAMACNPVPIIVPCHRVVAADGSLTGYSGGAGVETKAKLLRLEGAAAF